MNKSKFHYLTKTGYKSYNKVNSTNEFDTHHIPTIGFKLTTDNNYDMDNKRLTNVADPGEHKDAVNKEYVDGNLTRNTTNLLTSIDTIVDSKISNIPQHPSGLDLRSHQVNLMLP